MSDLEYFRSTIKNLALSKHWNDTELWLERSCFIELAELCEAIADKQTQREIAEEFADVMHYLLQIMNKNTPNIDLNKALTNKIASNSITPKKTYVEGIGIVRQ